MRSLVFFVAILLQVDLIIDCSSAESSLIMLNNAIFSPCSNIVRFAGGGGVVDRHFLFFVVCCFDVCCCFSNQKCVFLIRRLEYI